MQGGWGKSILATAGLCAGGSSAIVGGSTGAMAQVIPTRPQVEQTVPKEDLPTQPKVNVDSRNAIAPAPCALADSDIRVNLTALALERPDGSPLPQELQGLLAGVDADMHGEQSIAVVCRVRDRINQRLNDAGYVALAQIPAQQISDGTLRIQIVTARITELRIVGDPGPFRGQLEKAVEQIRALDPLNRRDAERILLLTGDIPGLDVNLTLSSANGAPGDVIGMLGVTIQRFALTANVQNYGSHQLGRWVGSVRAEAFGLTGMADRTFVAYSNSADWDEVRVVQAGHDFGLTQSGLRLGLRGSLATSRPDIESLDLRSRSIIAGIDLSMPVVRDLDRTVLASGGFEIINQRTRYHVDDKSLPFTYDKLRVIYARLEGDFRFDNGIREFLRARASLELRKGIDVLDATKQGIVSAKGAPSRLYGDPQAFVIKGDVDFELKPADAIQIDFGAFGQWTDDPLLNLEEFSLGNYTHGRGYDPGSNGGDRAYGFTVEPRVKLPVPRFGVQASAFYDWVRLENLDPGTLIPKRTLRSVGGGLRFLLPRTLVLDLTYAHPLDKVLPTDTKKPSDRFLVSLTAKLF
ncbi:ShlB/FhaC/HecB family hemolysin secretion/activation protein [Novosphingobium kaempferiae]|uniref:ShlB/FhaC/HecB family hemolysin secretion/activation protein n=1 Tax=Novosphingobium kaempferiae TaxID=2896849 RepID=UPI001E3340A9|nr:ShlB/FhaC/HecB family hemolysin secretion/activation protein [Novosphingobium kaempferiae]